MFEPSTANRNKAFLDNNVFDLFKDVRVERLEPMVLLGRRRRKLMVRKPVHEVELR